MNGLMKLNSQLEVSFNCEKMISSYNRDITSYYFFIVSFFIFLSSDVFATSRLTLRNQIAFDSIYTSGEQDTWLTGGNLGLRHSSGSNLNFSTIGVAARYGISNSNLFHLEAVVQQDPKVELAITQSYFLHRLKRTNRWKNQAKVGFFYAPWSIENTDLLWSSPYTSNFSTINSWLAEEVRTAGLEWRWTLPFKRHTGNWGFKGYIAIFGFNDTAGTLLSWRGWSSHDRQTGIGQSLTLPSIPGFEPDGAFSEQADRTKPFVEIDNRPGGYFGGEVKHRKGFKTKYSFYDNRADPNRIKSGLYAWRTQFHLFAIEHRISKNFTLLSQYLSGETEMGQQGSWVLNTYESMYGMLSIKRRDNRLAMRFERFRVKDKDNTFEDTNDEDGLAWAFSYGRRLNKSLELIANYTHWKSDRPGRRYNPNRNALLRENQYFLRVKFRR